MGFEVVVRPVVFPDIRPAPAQPQPPATDDPKKGIATIHGSNGKFLDLAYSWSVSSSQSNPNETQRRVDVVRVYQQEGDGGGSSVARGVAAPRAGNINRDNFVDIEVANKIWMDDGSVSSRYGYSRVQEDDNIEILERNKIKRPGE
jgi:hypothetical protein